jgi:hypothetical protein
MGADRLATAIARGGITAALPAISQPLIYGGFIGCSIRRLTLGIHKRYTSYSYVKGLSIRHLDVSFVHDFQSLLDHILIVIKLVRQLIVQLGELSSSKFAQLAVMNNLATDLNPLIMIVSSRVGNRLLNTSGCK